MTDHDIPGSVTGESTSRPRDALPIGSVLVLSILMGSTFLVLLNEMLLGVALPTLIADLGITPSIGQWVTTGYLLTLSILIPTTGFVIRRYALRTIFTTAMSLFVIGTAISTAAPTFGVLLSGRVVQAVGSAVFLPLLMTTAMRLVPGSRRGRIMAMVTAVPAIAPALGPSVSGLVLSHLDWRWLFILVLPAALFALLLGTLKLPNDSQREDVAIDLLSIAFSAIGFGGLVYGLATIGESAEGSSPVHPIMPLTLGLVGITAFVVRQVILRRSGNALVDMAVFRTRLFVVGLSVMVFVAMNGFGTLLIFPLVLSDALGLNTLLIGLFLAPGGILITLVAALGGRVYDRRGPRPLVIPGALVWVAVLSYLATLDQHTSVWVYFATYLVMCTAQATMWAPMTTLALSSLTPDLYPHGSAAFTTVQQLSGAAGGAILISAYTLGVKSADEGSTVGSVITGGQWAFTSAAVLSVGAVIGVAAIGRVRTTGVQNE